MASTNHVARVIVKFGYSSESSSSLHYLLLSYTLSPSKCHFMQICASYGRKLSDEEAVLYTLESFLTLYSIVNMFNPFNLRY